MRRYVKAVEVWQQYLEQDSHNIAVLTRMADAYRKIHDFQNSRNLYSQVVALDEHNSYALIGLAHLHYDFKKYREALIYWKKLLECAEHSVDIRVLTSIGNCYRKMKLFSQGLPYFQEALKRDPGNFYGFFGMADCYRKLGQKQKALETLRPFQQFGVKNRVVSELMSELEGAS